MPIKLDNLDRSLRAMIENNDRLGEVVWLSDKTSNYYERLKRNTFTDLIRFSLAEAIDRCTGSQGDEIKIIPGYTETITGAGGITCDVADVKITGMGGRNNMPAFLMDGAATVTALITAANVHLKNLKFKAGHADITKCMLISGKDAIIEACRFIQNTTNENFLQVIQAGVADNDYDGLKLIGNEIIQGDGAETGSINLLKNGTGIDIIGNRLVGDWAASTYAPVYMATAEIPLDILVANNLIHNQHDGNAAVGISITNTTATGFIVYNHVQHFDADGSTPVLAGAAGLYCGENYVSSVGGTASGYLYPAADDGAS